MEIYTIGFTRKSAATFFELLRNAGIRRLVDTRVNNTSQLAGFTKRDDLAFFLDELADADYEHHVDLAPTKELLGAYRGKELTWEQYEDKFLALLEERRVEQQLSRASFDRPTVLLCSEATADRCHRRLVAEYLAEAWGDLVPTHL